MRKIEILILILLVFIAPRVSFAHPPAEIELSYEIDEELLKVSVSHLTRDMKEHFVRRIKIQINDKDPESQYYKKQQSPALFSTEISVKAEPGDVITVKVYSEKGGSKEATFEVPEMEDDVQKPWARRRYDKKENVAPPLHKDKKKQKSTGY